jgi:hypothetical protein
MPSPDHLHNPDYPQPPGSVPRNPGASCPNLTSPAFWTPYRLFAVETQVWDETASAHHDVDRWDFTHVYPPAGTGDIGCAAGRPAGTPHRDRRGPRPRYAACCGR